MYGSLFMIQYPKPVTPDRPEGFPRPLALRHVLPRGTACMMKPPSLPSSSNEISAQSATCGCSLLFRAYCRRGCSGDQGFSRHWHFIDKKCVGGTMEAWSPGAEMNYTQLPGVWTWLLLKSQQTVKYRLDLKSFQCHLFMIWLVNLPLIKCAVSCAMAEIFALPLKCEFGPCCKYCMAFPDNLISIQLREVLPSYSFPSCF